jgi:hypothetical protein
MTIHSHQTLIATPDLSDKPMQRAAAGAADQKEAA